MLASKNGMPGAWWIALVLAASGYAWAWSRGSLGVDALPWLALLLASAWAVQRQRRPWMKIGGHALFVVIALALALHALPGFGNGLVIGPVQFSPASLPYSMYLNLDKPLIGLWLLLACPWIVAARPTAAAPGATALAAAAAVAVCMAVALALQAVAWDPKWPPQAWLWAANNLLLVCMAEEALFRGYLMGGLQRRGGMWAVAALPLSAMLFGLAHMAGGWQWVLLATLAGLAYGWAYRRGGLLAAVGAHFLLNLAHFAGFSYPALAPG